MAFKNPEDKRRCNARSQRKARNLNRDNPSMFLKRLLCETKKRAKKRGMDYDLDIDWAMAEYNGGSCRICGLPYSHEKHKGYRSPYHPSIDRLDNSKGYTKSNCRIISWQVNNAMADLPDSFFWTMVTSAGAHIPDQYKPLTETGAA